MKLSINLVGLIIISFLQLMDCFEKILKRDPQCFIQGRCIESQHVDGQTSKNEIECLEICKFNEKCKWFSFKLENNFCELLNNCTQLEENNLFISGSTECMIPGCWINGQCLGTVYHSETLKNKRDCLFLCKSDYKCNWFTYYVVNSECVLYRDCPTIDESCSQCTSGEHSCREEEKPSGFTKLLVGTGNDGPVPTDNVEVVDLASTTSSCKQLPNYPLKLRWSFGGLFNYTTPIFCGGLNGTDFTNGCYLLNQNSWIEAQPMTIPRHAAAMTKYPSSMSISEQDLLVIGGGNSGGLISSLDVFGPSGWISIAAQLPEGLIYACAVTVNDTHVLITGGYTDSQAFSASTIWFDSVNEKFSPGPILNSVRGEHGCSKILSQDGNAVYIIVAGGNDGSNSLDSTEILEPGSDEWKLGPKLPLQIKQTIMVEDHATNSVVLVAGNENGTSSNKIFRLGSPLTITSQWEELPQKLDIGRERWPVVFFIPDSFADCQG